MLACSHPISGRCLAYAWRPPTSCCATRTMTPSARSRTARPSTASTIQPRCPSRSSGRMCLPTATRLSMQHLWDLRATWKPTAWNCNLAVTVNGLIVGAQSAASADFATTRTALTGSFLFLPEQGRGIGTEMRVAILHLLFAGLDAEFAESAAWADNAQSLRVTEKLGYELVEGATKLSRGKPRDQLRFRLSRAEWETRRRDDITIHGLEPCLDLFGMTTHPTVSGSTDVGEAGSSRPAEE